MPDLFIPNNGHRKVSTIRRRFLRAMSDQAPSGTPITVLVAILSGEQYTHWSVNIPRRCISPPRSIKRTRRYTLGLALEGAEVSPYYSITLCRGLLLPPLVLPARLRERLAVQAMVAEWPELLARNTAKQYTVANVMVRNFAKGDHFFKKFDCLDT